MGTSGSYSGGGGKAGNDLRDGISDWLDSLPSSPPHPGSDPAKPVPEDGSSPPGEGDGSPYPPLGTEAVLPVVGLFRRRPAGGSDGPGGGGGIATGGGGGSGGGRRGGGAQRSASRSAGSAGRAAAAAYAYRTGDAEALRELGLDYDALRASGDPIEIAQRIVDAACESFSDGTIEDDERRYVAAAVALWVLEENEAGAPPEPDEIARRALAEILFEAMSGESAALLRDGKRATWATREGERQMRQAAEALAQTANLSPQGATAAEFERAIEQGLETLQSIWGES